MARVAAALLAVVLQAAPNPALANRTRTLVQALFDGRPEAIAALFDARMREALTVEQLRQAVAAVTGQAGAFQAIRGDRLTAQGGHQVVVLTCEFATAAVDVAVAWTADRKVAGLTMRPATATAEYTPPSYAAPSRFEESAVTVDAGTGWPLPGTLALPGGDGPFPAVVLVHGSGPNDRDASVGPNRPFRDLAWGLASRGIAVLRYDKRTHVHGPRIAPLTSFTVRDETVEDAVAAAALLRRTPKVGAERVFVLGHSLGGMLAPRIGAADPTLAGLVVLAGAVRPLAETVLAQTTYLAELDGTVTSAERSRIAEAETAVAQVRALKPGDPPVAGLLGRAPASYLIDLRGYAPPTAARALRLPMLVLQGERDYQVTMQDFAAWRAALDGRPDVRFVSYPALNHLFIAGTGASSPGEYMVPAHVDPQVIDDIAGWIAAR